MKSFTLKLAAADAALAPAAAAAAAAGTPELIAAALTPPEAVEVVQHLEGLAVDEVDACFQVSGC
jgi:hypothetical protein